MKFREIISNFDRVLNVNGFQRNKSTWNLSEDLLIKVIDLQISKSGDRFTINVGISFKSVFFTCWGYKPAEFIEEPYCTVRARIGQLIDGNDRWWDVEDPKAIEDAVACLDVFIFPFLKKIQSPSAACEWLMSTGLPSHKSPLSSIYLAILKSQLGQADVSCEILHDMKRNSLGAWKEKAQEVAMRLGCDG